MNQLKTLPRRNIHQLRVDIFDELLLNSSLNVCEYVIVPHAVQLSTELLQSRLSPHSAELVVFEVGLSDVLGDSRKVSLAQVVVLARHCTRKQSSHDTRLEVERRQLVLRTSR